LGTTFRPQIENHLAILAAVEFFSDRLARSAGVMFATLRRRDALHRTLEAHWAYRGVYLRHVGDDQAVADAAAFRQAYGRSPTAFKQSAQLS
jgi:hypothetical protein